jgi:hypothetical protein
MPSLRSRSVQWPSNYRPVAPQPVNAPIMALPTPPHVQNAADPAMISSLPNIAATLDGPQRQFYGGAFLPKRRVSLPL